MPITLRARPTCHYCGKRNSPSHSQRKFTCQYCQADNYLDESGQITDVPASAAAPSQRYAVPVTPAFEAAEGSLFCSICLKNQYMYNAALSEYLPDPDHPEYDQFEAAIPAFKQELERRYPTCCARCEPKVKAQLQQATYNARSDHLRRVLDRSKQRRHANKLGWRYLLVNTAGLGWLVSLLVQMGWHILGSQTYDNVTVPNLRPTECLTTWPVPMQCSLLAEQTIGPSLMIGALCIWWNPKWQHKLEGRGGRLIGLDKFYKTQALLLALRFTLWIIAKDVPKLASYRPMIHAVSLFLIAMIAGWSRFSIVGIYTPQIVDWSQDPAPLLDSKQYVPPTPMQEISPPNSQQAVPVGIFNTSAARGPQPWRPPTPPVEEDAMEWDPTPTTFNPNLRRIKYKSQEATPFQGTLPAFPKGGIYQTKNERAIEQPKAIGLPLGFFDKSHGKPIDHKSNTTTNSGGLSQPKFFPDIARADTGLENIFDKVFSLKDEANIPTRSSTGPAVAGPKELIRSLPSEYVREGAALSSKIAKFYYIVMASVLAVVALLVWAQLISESMMLNFLTAVPFLDLSAHLGSRLWTRSGTFDLLRILTPIVENSLLVFLNYVQPGTRSVLWNKVVFASVNVALIQELYCYCIEDVSQQVTRSGRALQGSEAEPVVTAPPPPKPVSQPASVGFPGLRRSSSDESVASTASIATTSTASGWKTPVKNHREELRGAVSSTSYGFGGLSLKNDHNFGSSTSVAGPRNRTPGGRGSARGW